MQTFFAVIPKQRDKQEEYVMAVTNKKALLKLLNKIAAGTFEVTEEAPEYHTFSMLVNDEQVKIMLTMKVMVPLPVAVIALKSGLPIERTRKNLHELADMGIVGDGALGPGKAEVYMLLEFAPGVYEFMMLNEKLLKKHPEVAADFKGHATVSYEKFAANTPMGAGVMRVIPYENALPADTKPASLDRVSHYLKNSFGKIAVVPCQCRRVRKMLGELTGDHEDGMCVFLGPAADYAIRHGRGKQISMQEAEKRIKYYEELGCVHEITTLFDNFSLAICNCKPESCLALGVAQSFNIPEVSRSNFVAEIDKEKCVACGKCVEMCANNALKLGQKICTNKPIPFKPMDLPVDHEWGPERYNLNYRSVRPLVVETGTAPCKATCPAHLPVQGYIRLASQGKYLEALELIKTRNPFPAVCGRVCPHPCEKECTRGDIDQAVSIDEIKKFIAEQELYAENRAIPKKLHNYGKKIAIIGSGPAGLSCAYYLAADGYKVTVFEKEAIPGGMMTLGIPNFRLDHEVVNAEIDVLRQMGVVFRCNTEVGRDVTIPQLRDQGFEGFYLAIGLQNGGKLNIPGDDAQGVMAGIDYIKQINSGKKVDLGDEVVVIGGGNIGADVARTIVRQGAGKVKLYCLEDYDGMPMGEEDRSACETDGIEIHAGWGQIDIKAEDGRAKGIRFHKCLSVKNEEGRFDPKFDDSQIEETSCTALVYCIGQRVDYGQVLTGVHVELTERGLVKSDPVTYATTEKDIFVGGDVYTGQKFVIDAIAAGRKGAISIHRAVWEGHSLTLWREKPDDFKELDKSNIDHEEVLRTYDNTPRQKPDTITANVGTMSDERAVFTPEQLKKEAARCLGCGATIVDQNKCLGCGVCTSRCHFDAIHLIRRTDQKNIPLFARKYALPKYKKERAEKIRITRMFEEQ